MTEITIKFDLPEEQGEYDLIYHSSDMYSALVEIQNYLRSIEKGYLENSEDLYNEKLFERIRNLIEESGIWQMM